MKGIFIAPNSFNDPENPQHGEFVHTQLKSDLYNATVFEVFVEEIIDLASLV
jgi:hypothetical protein